jgi:hypothetical protein
MALIPPCGKRVNGTLLGHAARELMALFWLSGVNGTPPFELGVNGSACKGQWFLCISRWEFMAARARVNGSYAYLVGG